MTKIDVVLRGGRRVSIDALPGRSVMESLREGGIAEVAAICGGSMSCGTCHVYVDPSILGMFPPANDEEDAMLATLLERREISRLSCQLKIPVGVQRLALTVAPE